jgi:hypothetical protein
MQQLPETVSQTKFVWHVFPGWIHGPTCDPVTHVMLVDVPPEMHWLLIHVAPLGHRPFTQTPIDVP